MDKDAFDELVLGLMDYTEKNYQYSWTKGYSGISRFKYGKVSILVCRSGVTLADGIFVGHSSELHCKLMYMQSSYFNSKRLKELETITHKLKLSKMSTPEKVKYYWGKVINWLNT